MTGRETWTALRPSRSKRTHQHRLPAPENWPDGAIVRRPCGQRFKSATRHHLADRPPCATWVRRWLPWPR